MDLLLSTNAAYKLANHQSQNNIHIIDVKIDIFKDNISYLQNITNVVPFYYGEYKIYEI